MKGTKPVVDVQATIKNSENRRIDINLITQVFSPEEGLLIEKKEPIAISVFKQKNSIQTLEIPNAELWDTENPHKYPCIMSMILGGRIVDKCETTFSIREVDFSKKGRIIY